MSIQTQAIRNDLSRLAEDAGALVNATANVAGDKVGEARHRLNDALERCKDLYGGMRGTLVERSKAADGIVQEHFHQAIAVGIATGALLGYLLARRFARAQA